MAAANTRVDDTAGVSGFTVPRPLAGHVSRPRLLEQLGTAGTVPLVVVTGPPGSGKSALVSEWVHRAGDSVRAGWITFDQGQDDFWGSVTRCLARLGFDLTGEQPAGGPGQPAGDCLPDPDLSVSSPEPRIVVVLDGLELTSPRLARQADFVLRKFDRQLTFVITSRVDPLLPLAAYRRRRMAVEVREADLRCTDAEAIQVWGAAGVRVGAAEVAALNHRLGGWLGGLALAARSAHDAPDPALAAAAVSDGSSSMQEYLLRQALDSRPDREREFLLAASVVDVLVPGLAARVAGPDAEELAARLAAAHLFLEPLTRPETGWRLQPMLRDLLRAHLAFEDPSAWERANRRAAGWYRDHGRVEAAVEHLVEAAAWSEAAELLVDSGQVVRIVTGAADDSVLEAASHVPTDLIVPSAHLVRAALALARGAETDAAAELSLAEGTHEEATTVFTATAAVLRAWSAAALADLAEAEAAEVAARAAACRLTALDGSGLASLRALAGLAGGYLRLRAGRWEEAAEALVGAVDEAPEEAVRLRVMAWGYTALASALSGRLTDAGVAAARAVSLIEESGTPPGQRCPAPYLALGYIALERGDLLATRRHRDQAQESDRSGDGPVEHVVQALLRAGELSDRGEPVDARTLHETAEQVSASPPLTDLLRLDTAWSVLPDEPRRAAAELESLHEPGRPAALVLRAAALRRTDPAGAVSMLRLAEGSPHDLRTEVQRLLTEADLELGRGGTARGRSRLDEALSLAAPERLRRPFRHVSEQARRLLRTDTTLRARHPWLIKAHVSDPAARGPGVVVPAQRARLPVRRPGRHEVAGSGARPGDAALIEPLTVKEMEVLAHLNHLLDTEEIADVMVVSVNTVRTHVRHVLRKLGVDRRNAAVRRAWELGLLPGPDVR